MEAIAIRLEAFAITVETKDRKKGPIKFAIRLEAIASRLEALAIRLEAVATRNKGRKV